MRKWIWKRRVRWMAGEHVRDGKASYRSQSYIMDVKTNEREKKKTSHTRVTKDH